jgi:hypothetical protein
MVPSCENGISYEIDLSYELYTHIIHISEHFFETIYALFVIELALTYNGRAFSACPIATKKSAIFRID